MMSKSNEKLASANKKLASAKTRLESPNEEQESQNEMITCSKEVFTSSRERLKHRSMRQVGIYERFRRLKARPLSSKNLVVGLIPGHGELSLTRTDGGRQEADGADCNAMVQTEGGGSCSVDWHQDRPH